MTADESYVPALYVITLDNPSSPNDPFAYTDDGGIATARTRQEAFELKEWIAYEFMGWDTTDPLTVKKAVLLNVEYPVEDD